MGNTVSSPQTKATSSSTMNQAQVLIALQQKLATQPKWARRALNVVFAKQTADEKAAAYGVVRHNNSVGFRVQDAEILTSFARQLSSKGTLSPKQEALLMRKMPKYARQLLRLQGPAIRAYFAKPSADY